MSKKCAVCGVKISDPATKCLPCKQRRNRENLMTTLLIGFPLILPMVIMFTYHGCAATDQVMNASFSAKHAFETSPFNKGKDSTAQKTLQKWNAEKD